MQGSSLRPLIEGQKKKLHDTVYAEVSVNKNQVFAAAIAENSKIIVNLDTGSKQLFDPNSDPDEKNNIYKVKSSAKLSPLEHCLIAWLFDNERLAKQIVGSESLQKVELDENRVRELKALGYLQ
jgi:hypothetical protein